MNNNPQAQTEPFTDIDALYELPSHTHHHYYELRSEGLSIRQALRYILRGIAYAHLSNAKQGHIDYDEEDSQ